MNDAELRALVRAAIAQQAAAHASSVVSGQGASSAYRQLITGAGLHPSHGRFTLLPAGSDADGPCLIEPAVPCNHCGYCQSYGH
jgi:hypothetical protein